MKNLLVLFLFLFIECGYTTEKDTSNRSVSALNIVHSFIRALETDIPFTREMNEQFFVSGNDGRIEYLLHELLQKQSPGLFSKLQPYSFIGELIRNQRNLFFPLSVVNQKSLTNMVGITAFASNAYSSWRSSLGYQPQSKNFRPAGEQVIDVDNSFVCCVTVIISTGDVQEFQNPKSCLTFFMVYNSVKKRYYIEPAHILVNGKNLMELIGISDINSLPKEQTTIIINKFEKIAEEHKKDK